MEKIPDLGQMVLMILLLVVMNIILLTTYVNHKYDFFLIKEPGLFTGQDCCVCKVVIHDVVL
jgi:hypothetical protein